ncbi:MAG: ribbon-helix-helix protein, CopG family [Synechococcaceae cyanobacterium RM1_1_27]|nr:ribbon-helix-helix protein, CopG family [Synechococcaceae cyanobacterium RM1_1_27]
MAINRSAPRDDRGRLLERPDSLSKQIGLRLPKNILPKFEQLAEQKGLSISELSRIAVMEWLDTHQEQEGSQ